jgi:hypothetical protein
MARRDCGSHESNYADSLLDVARARGFAPETAALDMGYDTEAIHAACEDWECRPIIALKQTPAVKAGKASPPSCEHGTWTFAGAEPVRNARSGGPHRRVQAGLPGGQGGPPYRARASVEREFGRLQE